MVYTVVDNNPRVSREEIYSNLERNKTPLSISCVSYGETDDIEYSDVAQKVFEKIQNIVKQEGQGISK